MDTCSSYSLSRANLPSRSFRFHWIETLGLSGDVFVNMVHITQIESD